MMEDRIQVSDLLTYLLTMIYTLERKGNNISGNIHFLIETGYAATNIVMIK